MLEFMQRALQIAQFGLGSVAPNPMVGCVIVHQNKIISEGWHMHYGGPHAEVNALLTINNPLILKEAEMYVSLEPCSHYGKTPPCANRIIEVGIPKVFIAMEDPNPLVKGKGIARLKEAGIQVETGFLEKEAGFINRRFICFIQKKRPYIILKWAETNDGFIDIERNRNEIGSFRITSAIADQQVHKWRTEESAILIGSKTGFTDNPKLTARHFPGKHPVRVVLDKNLEVPHTHYIRDNSTRTIIFNQLQNRTKSLIEEVQLDFNKPILNDVLAYLHSTGIQSVIVEGGAHTIQTFYNEGLWDEIRIIKSPDNLIRGKKAPQLNEGLSWHYSNLGRDLLSITYSVPFSI